jgi:hypothetical protein
MNSLTFSYLTNLFHISVTSLKQKLIRIVASCEYEPVCFRFTWIKTWMNDLVHTPKCCFYNVLIAWGYLISLWSNNNFHRLLGVFWFWFWFFFAVLGFELGLHLESLHQSFFVMGIFEIGSCELFAQAGFKLRSSWSLPPE